MSVNNPEHEALMEKMSDFMGAYSWGFSSLFGVSADDLEKYYQEDKYSGYPTEPGGSVWESEGKALYAMIRLLKPNDILEIGNFKGCSANHILQAVEMNGKGLVTLLDIAEQLEYEKLHNDHFVRLIWNSTDWLLKKGVDSSGLSYDLYVIDGNHSYEHTKKELELIIQCQKVPCWIWSHDYHVTHDPSCQVRKTWDEMKHHFAKFEAFKDSISNCGFCIAKFEPK